MTIAHRVNEPIQVTQEWIGKAWDFDDDNTAATVWPDPVTNPLLGPHEDYVQWHDLDSGGTLIQLNPDSGPATATLNTLAWEITIDNNVSPRFIIQAGREGSQPQRDTKRDVTVRLTIEKDDGWQACANIFGATSNAAVIPADISFDYTGAATNEDAFFRVNNCRVTSIPPGVADEGPLEMDIELRGHATGAGTADDDTVFWFDVANDEEGPATTNNPDEWGQTCGAVEA